jgi:hypothetical protein
MDITQRFHQMKQFIYFLLLWSSICSQGQAQVVNVESQRLQMDTQRVTAGINFALEYKDNNEETMLKIESAAVWQKSVFVFSQLRPCAYDTNGGE